MPRKQNRIISVLYVMLPLTALAAAGVASFLWFSAGRQTQSVLPGERRDEPQSVAPDTFSDSLKEALPALLREYGVGEKGIRKVKPDSSLVGIREVYRVAVPSSTSLYFLHLKIREMAGERGGEVLSGVESADGRSLTLKLGSRSVATDFVILQKTPGLEVKKAVMAVIVDDLGIHGIESARRLCMLGQTVTLSVLPFQRNTREVVDLAVETGTPYLLHMPMEPSGAAEDPGEGAILTVDSDIVIERKLALAFDSVYGARGMNNHMGSKVTENLRVMETVMRYLRVNGCFFVDSRTSPGSVAHAVSQRAEVKCAAMAGYLDVTDDRESIRRRLHELATTAFELEEVIVICHDRPATVDVLEQELPRLAEQGIRFVAAAELVK